MSDVKETLSTNFFLTPPSLKVRTWVSFILEQHLAAEVLVYICETPGHIICVTALNEMHWTSQHALCEYKDSVARGQTAFSSQQNMGCNEQQRAINNPLSSHQVELNFIDENLEWVQPVFSVLFIVHIGQQYLGGFIFIKEWHVSTYMWLGWEPPRWRSLYRYTTCCPPPRHSCPCPFSLPTATEKVEVTTCSHRYCYFKAEFYSRFKLQHFPDANKWPLNSVSWKYQRPGHHLLGDTKPAPAHTLPIQAQFVQHHLLHSVLVQVVRTRNEWAA